MRFVCLPLKYGDISLRCTEEILRYSKTANLGYRARASGCTDYTNVQGNDAYRHRNGHGQSPPKLSARVSNTTKKRASPLTPHNFRKKKMSRKRCTTDRHRINKTFRSTTPSPDQFRTRDSSPPKMYDTATSPGASMFQTNSLHGASEALNLQGRLRYNAKRDAVLPRPLCPIT